MSQKHFAINSQVIQLLEMPGKSVTPETAASVLCRIGMFDSVGEHLGSFIRRAVLNELCEMVCHDFESLSCKTVIDLIKWAILNDKQNSVRALLNFCSATILLFVSELMEFLLVGNSANQRNELTQSLMACRCCLRPNCYEAKFLDSIKTEVERRIVKNSFSISNVCEMVTVLSEHTGGKLTDILESCWVHLGSRFLEINETNISEVFEVGLSCNEF